MPSKAETARRVERHRLIEERAATVAAEVSGINRHFALALAAEDGLWDGEATDWRWMAANTSVDPCQLSCCND